jgi:hypothetical protein
METKYVFAANSLDEEIYNYVKAKREIADLVKKFTAMEADYVRGMRRPPAEVLQQIEELHRKDTSVDTNIMDYLRKFMGGMGKGGLQANQVVNWYKIASYQRALLPRTS